MSFWKIAWRSIQQRSLASVLTALSMALGVALMVVVIVVGGSAGESFQDNAGNGYNLIVGGKGGALQLTLNTVYRISKPLEPIKYSFYKEFLPATKRNDDLDGEYAAYVSRAVPVCLGDYFEEFRVVGTTPEYFEPFEGGREYNFAQGRNFKPRDFFGAVIGAAVARESGLILDSTFQPTHSAEDGHVHDDLFTVRGVLEPMGTADDRSVFINLEGFYLLEGHAKPEAKSGSKAGSEPKVSEHKHDHGSDPHHHDHHEHGDHEHDHAADEKKSAKNSPAAESAEHDHKHDNEDHDAKAHKHGDSKGHDHEHGDHAHDHKGQPKVSAHKHDHGSDPHHHDHHEHGDHEHDHAADEKKSAKNSPAAVSAEHDHKHDNENHDAKAHKHGDSKADDHGHGDHAHDHKGHEHGDHDHAGHDHSHEGHDHAHDHGHHHEPLPESAREVTALLVRTSDLFPGVAAGLAQQINEGTEAQAVSPIGEITRLFNTIVGPLERVLYLLTALIIVVAAMSIMVGMYNSMSERKHQIAVMRALGASRGTVGAIVLLESILLSLLGGVFGWLLGHIIVGLASPTIQEYTGTWVGFFRFVPRLELVLIPALVALASLVGCLPALVAYRTDVAKALTSNP